MSRSRLVVVAALSLAAAGLLAAGGAFLLDTARASVGPLPAEGLALPGDSRFVMGVDVKRLAASPLYEKYAARHRQSRPEAFKELEERTGLNPERDVDRLIVAGQGGQRMGVVLVQGRFDPYKLGREIETRKKGVSHRTHEGKTVYLFDEGAGKQTALTFLDDDTIVLGAREGVESTVASHARGGESLRTNAALVALLERVEPGATFWMVGDQSLLAHVPKSVPAPGAAAPEGAGSGASIQLPALQSLVVTGDLDPVVSVEVTGDAADEAGAKNLADVVRGFVALAQLQARQKPELKELASNVSVTTEANRVHVSARVPYELLDALQAQRPTTRPSAP